MTPTARVIQSTPPGARDHQPRLLQRQRRQPAPPVSTWTPCLLAAQTIIDAAKLTADQDSVGASKFVCFANMVEDSPFMAGAVHGGGEADAVINVGVSGPGVMAAALETLPDPHR